MADVEVCIELAGRPRLAGVARRHRARGGETVTFAYGPEWLADPDGFALESPLCR